MSCLRLKAEQNAPHHTQGQAPQDCVGKMHQHWNSFTSSLKSSWVSLGTC